MLYEVITDAGMGSSAMGASLLRKKVQAAGLPIQVTNLAINNLDETADLVITHQDLTERARITSYNVCYTKLLRLATGGVIHTALAPSPWM